MKRLLAIAIIVTAVFAAVLPHAGMTMTDADHGMVAGHCMDGRCPAAGRTASDCADRCLAAGPLQTESGIATSTLVAFTAFVILSAASAARPPEPAKRRRLHEAIGKALALERVATDVLRN
jgi:hypothetical protein